LWPQVIASVWRPHRCFSSRASAYAPWKVTVVESLCSSAEIRRLAEAHRAAMTPGEPQLEAVIQKGD